MIKNEHFKGERPLYRQCDLNLNSCRFEDGESALKEGCHITTSNCEFNSKYPYWHCSNIVLKNDYFMDGGRAAIWYSQHIHMEDTKVIAPKIFRDAKDINIINCIMETEETLWDCQKVKIKNTEFKGDYVLFHSSEVELDHFLLDGNYSFQHVRNMTIRNSTIRSKDAFWNSENITVYDSDIDGQYLGWYSKNLKLVNCTIRGTQPLCYCQGLVLENCRLIETDLSFELSDVDAHVTTVIKSVKNPKSGSIRAKGIEEIIMEESEINQANTEIILVDEGQGVRHAV